MSKWSCIAILSLPLIIGFFQPVQAEWTLPARIAEFDHSARFPHAIAVGETLHVVVTTDYCYPYIHCFRSFDNGMSWTEPDSPVIPYGPSGQARLFFADGLIHLTWYGEGQNPPEAYIFHATSSDGGRTWSDIQEPPFPYGLVTDPRLAADGDILIFIGRGWNMLSWARSPDNGQTWDWGGYLEYGSENIGFDYPPCINIFFSGGAASLNISDEGF